MRIPGSSRSPRGPAGRWLSLGEAARLLGVSPGTLRRWADGGRIPVFTTPGGHRRFPRDAVERLAAPVRPQRPSVTRAGVTPVRVLRTYRREARRVVHRLGWTSRLTEVDRAWFRDHGRELVRLLIGHLDAVGDDARRAALDAATAEAAEHGRMTARLGLSLGEAVETFLQFRRPFLEELRAVGRRRALEAADVSQLLGAAERAMDRLLVAMMNAHSVARVRPRGDEPA